jgi:hypothetical protein
MKDFVIDTFMCIKKQLSNNKRENSFEFLGYDFLIDEDFRIWLIEVNSNPYIGVPNEYMKNMLPDMIDDMMKIVLDPIFPQDPPPPDRENYFDLIYSPGNTENSEIPVNKRSEFSLSNLYPIPSLQDESITSRIKAIKQHHLKRIERNIFNSKRNASIDYDESNRIKDIR